MKITSKKKKKLEHWKEIVASDELAYSANIINMEERERIFRGKKDITEILEGDKIKSTPHVRNIVSELIESQINSNIPMPKVTALRAEDEKLAKLIEDMIRNKLNKLPMEANNDLMERTVPVQGGGLYLYEWDNNKRTHTTIGEGILSFRHPKQVIPQEGVTSGIEDMDHITVKIPQTVEYIKRKYNVDVSEDGEEDPSLRSPDGTKATSSNMVTQYCVYYRNDSGGIGLISWVCETVLVDLEDYQARHLRRCRNCGEPEPPCEVDEIPPTYDGTYPINEENPDEELIIKSGIARNRCPHCGGTYKDSTEDFRDIRYPFELPNGSSIEAGAKIPYYKPDIYPVLLQRNVSSFGEFLGESDVDKIADQQNTINRLYAKMLSQLLNAGSYITLPDDVSIKKDSEEGKVIKINDIKKKGMIGVFSMTADISPSLAMVERIYAEAQQIIGVTDSFLGRKDATATSGKAKEFSAAQAAGRLESKRVMKNEMYARLFEAMFKFELAYADDERPVVGTDNRGNHRDESWHKWLFLKQDDSGAYYWNTDFLFETDSTAPLANNREALWQETRSHFETDAFGDHTQLKTKITYWEQMAALHYPNAARIRDILREEEKKQEETVLKQAQAQKEALEMAKQSASGQINTLQGGTVDQTQLPIPGINGGE